MKPSASSLLSLSLSPSPVVRDVAPAQVLTWLVLGWRDMLRCGWVSWVHGLGFAVFGALVFSIAVHRFWLLAGAFSGFLVVAPILATSLYALSRAIERGEKPNFALVYKTWTHWQISHQNKGGNDYWRLVQFGTLLALAGTGWVFISAAFITLMSATTIQTPIDFVQHVILAKQGWVFELWLGLGGLLAAPIFASTAVSVPLLLDRKISLLQAVLTSWSVVLANPFAMALWAAIIMGLSLLGLAFAFAGLIVVIPWLGHASWHAYRGTVDVANLPEVDAGMKD